MQEAANSFQGSPQQDEQWRREPDGPAGRVQAVVRFDGPLDADALSGAVRQAVQRHESLRTTFARQPGIRIPLQVVNDELEPGWETLDASAADAETQLAAALASERARSLDFELGPLLHALLMRLADERHVLLLTASTLCADPSSMTILVTELAASCGASAEIVEEPLQYADFSAWQQESSESEDEEAMQARERWTALADASSPRVPFARQSEMPSTTDEVTVELDAAVTPATVQAAWHALLSRLSGEREVVVQFLSPDRRHLDLEGAIGAFARPVPVSTAVDGTTPFQTLLAEIEAARKSVLQLQDYTPSETSAALTIGFSEYDRYRGQAADLAISLERILVSGRRWSLWLTYARGGDQGAAWISFDPECHQRESVKRLALQLMRLVSDAASHPSKTIGELDLLGGAEWDLVLCSFNDTSTPAAGARVHDLFAAHAAASPARDAVLDGHRSLSYAELDTRANQLANLLRAAGVGPDVTVGLCTDRSVEMAIGVLGILKAGGAYVPLNYEHPPARLGDQLATAGAQVILTQERLLSHLPESDREVVCLDRDGDRAALHEQPTTAPEVDLTDANLAYVIYTSGSTGVPKGVAVTHGNLANYVADITPRLGADSEALAFGLVTSISTDLGNTSVFGALGSGGTLVLLSPAASADAAALARQLEATPVDVLKITPSHVRALLAGNDANVLPRRTLVVGGERAPWDLVEQIRGISSCAIFNHYGPTETTVGCCIFAVDNGAGPYQPATVPIGRPIANTSCYVLDDRLQPVPIGVPGRLFVGGTGVAAGYIGQPDLTAELFIADPFGASTAARMYNTGDLARWLPDGSLEFLGRSDDQVKIRGYRVEPAEIESALRAHVDVGEAVVVTAESPSGERRLVAYCTTVGGTGDDLLRSHLAGLLPEFMIPSAILTLDSMPRTPSGKIDRLSLPDPSTLAESAGAAYVAPRTPMEKAIAAVWAQTLGVERIGVGDDFFELGGHSLLATQVVAHVRSEFDVDLPLHSLFTCPTVEQLAAEIVQMMGSSEQDETAKLLAELEGLSDEEADRLLTEDLAQPNGGER